MNNQLAVMCYSTGTIFLYSLEKPLQEDEVEDHIISLGHKPSQCHWMTTSTLIEIEDLRN